MFKFYSIIAFCLCVFTADFSYAVNMPMPMSVTGDSVIAVGGVNYRVDAGPYTTPPSAQISYHFPDIQSYYTFVLSSIVIEQNSSTQLSMWFAEIIPSFPADVPMGIIKWDVFIVADPVNTFPLPVDALKSAYLNIISPSYEQLEKIIKQLDKITGDPVNDALVPESMRGRIISNQYMFLMGGVGILSASMIGLFWSRGL